MNDIQLYGELQAYLRARYERAKDAVYLLCGNDNFMRQTLQMQWERDFWRDKYLALEKDVWEDLQEKGRKNAVQKKRKNRRIN